MDFCSRCQDILYLQKVKFFDYYAFIKPYKNNLFRIFSCLQFNVGKVAGTSDPPLLGHDASYYAVAFLTKRPVTLPGACTEDDVPEIAFPDKILWFKKFQGKTFIKTDKKFFAFTRCINFTKRAYGAKMALRRHHVASTFIRHHFTSYARRVNSLEGGHSHQTGIEF